MCIGLIISDFFVFKTYLLEVSSTADMYNGPTFVIPVNNEDLAPKVLVWNAAALAA